MKITILCENETSYKGSKTCLSEWGLSFWVETKNTKILFDTGHTDIYKTNAEKLNINLENLNFIVLSHHHFDHAKGLQYHNFKNKKKLIIHPEIISKLPANESKKIKSDFEIIASKEALNFSKNIRSSQKTLARLNQIKQDYFVPEKKGKIHHSLLILT